MLGATVFVVTLTAGCVTSRHVSPATNTVIVGSSAPMSSSGPASGSPQTTASIPATPSATAATTPSVSGVLHKVGDVALPQPSTGLVLATEAPDGAVFATVPGGKVVWTVKRETQPAVAEHVPGGADALAADANYLYIASGGSVVAYSRTTGNPTHQWAVPTAKGTVLDLAITGTRLWAGLGTEDSDPAPLSNLTLVELSLTIDQPLRQVTVPLATRIVGGPTGLYYVVASKTLIEQTDAGGTLSAPVHDPVNLELSGPSAIQVVGVDGDHLLVAHFAGQGLDGVLHTYDSATLVGPSNLTPYMADTALVVIPDGLVALRGEGDCGPGNSCLTPVQLKDGFQQPQLGVAPGLLLGPLPAVVTGVAGDGNLHVLWFAR